MIAQSLSLCQQLAEGYSKRNNGAGNLQRVAATLEAPRAAHFWIVPTETACESEEGFERVYQDSQILALWRAELASAAP